MRKLAIFAAALAAAVFLSHYALPSGYYVWAAVVLALFGAVGFLFRGDSRCRVILICLGAALGFAVCAVNYANTIAPCIELSAETREFNAEVLEYPYEADSFSSVVVKLTEDGMPKVKAILYGLHDQRLPPLSPGDEIRVTAQLKYSGERYGNLWSGHTSDNIHLVCYAQELEITGRSAFSWMYFPQDIERAINARTAEIMSEDAAPFMVALLTGNTELLYEDPTVYAAMAHSGVLHVVAVSGMHILYLLGFLNLIMRRKKTVALVAIPIIWLFAAVTGAPPSIVRAAFMQTVILLAPLIKREGDTLTSLSAVLALLLVINPTAIADIGLQLSFSAVLGMIFITPKVNRTLSARLIKKRRERMRENGGKNGFACSVLDGLLRAVISSFAASIGALVFTTPIIASYFGTMQIYTIIVNILIFWAVSLSFILGFIAVIISVVSMSAGVTIGLVASIIARMMIALIVAFGNFPLAQIYVGEGYFLFWIVASYVLFFLWLIFRRRKSFRPIIPICLMLTGLFVGVVFQQVSAQNEEPRFTALDVGQGQSILVTAPNAVAVIDCGGKGSLTNAGDAVATELMRRGISAVDVLCITHFDEDHINGAIRLMSNMRVKNLIIAPETPNDTLREEIIAIAEKRGVVVNIISETTEISFGEILLTVYEPVSRIKPELVYFAQVGESGILVTGDADETAEKRLIMNQNLPDVDIFVAGHHGSRYSSSMELLESIDAETAIISCGYNSYGHPTQEVLDRFSMCGMTILRTDEQGRIEILLG